MGALTFLEHFLLQLPHAMGVLPVGQLLEDTFHVLAREAQAVGLQVSGHHFPPRCLIQSCLRLLPGLSLLQRHLCLFRLPVLSWHHLFYGPQLLLRH